MEISGITNAVENQEKAQYSRLAIKSYGFYIAQQGHYDSDGGYHEICAILDLKIPNVQLGGNSFDQVEIMFRSAGVVKQKARYSTGKLHLEMEAQYLNYWLTGLQNPYTHVDISSIEPQYVKLFLYSGRKEQ